MERLRGVKAACERFEADWRSGNTPRIEEHLGECAEADRLDLLGELRRARGDHPFAIDPGAVIYLASLALRVIDS